MSGDGVMVEARRDFTFPSKFTQGKKKFSLPLFACMSNFVRSQVTHPSSFTGLLLRQRFIAHHALMVWFQLTNEKAAQIELSSDAPAALGKMPPHESQDVSWN